MFAALLDSAGGTDDSNVARVESRQVGSRVFPRAPLRCVSQPA